MTQALPPRRSLVFGLLAIVLGVRDPRRGRRCDGGGTVGYAARRALRRARRRRGSISCGRAARWRASSRSCSACSTRPRSPRSPTARSRRRSTSRSASSRCTRSASRRVVLGVVGLLFLIVALSYAEGTASIRETGGAATFVRVAFNDLAGFLTGWVLFLDYLIVIALSALFVPHYLGLALGIDAIARRPGRRDRGVRRRSRGIARVRLCPADAALHASASRCRCSTSSRSSCSCRSASRSSSRRSALTRGPLARHASDVARHRVRAAARDARVHRPRDGRELRGGGAAARARPAAQPLQRDLARRRHLRR